MAILGNSIKQAASNGGTGVILPQDVPVLNQNTTGNAATATLAQSAVTAQSANRLTTPRTINGVAFDGTANISIATGSALVPATTNTLGGVKVDGTTITIDANGVISAVNPITSATNLQVNSLGVGMAPSNVLGEIKAKGDIAGLQP